MIQAHNLSYRTATGYAVKDMSFTLSAGGIHGILGHKGAGKTTLLHLLSGVLSATDGSLTVSGHDMSKDARAVQARIGYLPSAEPLYNSMTVSEYLDFIGEAKRVAPDKRFRQIKSALELTELSDEADKLLARCSLSVRRRVGVAQALLGNPDLILMDEPLRGYISILLSTLHIGTNNREKLFAGRGFNYGARAKPFACYCPRRNYYG